MPRGGRDKNIRYRGSNIVSIPLAVVNTPNNRYSNAEYGKTRVSRRVTLLFACIGGTGKGDDLSEFEFAATCLCVFRVSTRSKRVRTRNAGGSKK